VRKTKYDWVIDLLSNPRSAMITALSGAKVRAGNERNFHKFYAYNFKFKYPRTDYIYNPDLKLNFLKQLGVKWPSEHAPLPKYYFTSAQLKKRDGIYKKAGINKEDTVIGFFATPGTRTRTWPARYFRELAPLLHKKYKAKIVVIYGPGEKQRALEITKNMPPYIALAPRTKNLEDLFIILGRLNLLIACCGGTKHMAVAAGAPTVTIHSMTYAEAWTPAHDPRHIALKATADCSPCFRGDCPHNMKCMATIPPQKVFEAAQKIL
jgi:ADP-heptose:LPS heptosyltransferase